MDENQRIAVRENIVKAWGKEITPQLEIFIEKMVNSYWESRYYIGNFDTWAYDNIDKWLKK
jgi:hypothetical protein